MWYIYFVFFGVIAAFPKTDQEYKQELTRHVMRCTKEHPVEMSELFNLEKLITPKNKDTKCLLACAYKNDGTMTKDGFYNMEHVKKMSEFMSNGDDTRRQNILKLGDTCKKVNEKAVSDGEKGCDRAGFIFKCIVENAAKFGFKM